MSQFFDQLGKELQPQIDKILHHPFVSRIKDGWLNESQLKYFVGQYGIYCDFFPRFLSAAAANIPDDPTRISIVENLWEEHGSGDINMSHRILYEKFATAFDFNPDTLRDIEPLGTTEICIENMLHICRQDHFLIALGALGPGTEYFTNKEYEIIVGGLRKYDFLTDDHLTFWDVHITLDEDHYGDMVKSIDPWMFSEENQKLVEKGAKKALALEYIFWEGLEDNLPNK